MKQIKALILDAGGVMVHPYHVHWNIPVKYAEYLGEYASDIPGEKFMQVCAEESVRHLGEDRYLPDIRDEYTCRYNYLKAVAERMDWDISEDTLTGLTEDFTYNSGRYVWYPDTDAVLTELHKTYKIGVLSDAMPSFTRVATEHDADLHNFDEMSISTIVGCAKPNPAMYEDILKKLAVPAENCLFVDDRVCNLEGARKMGIQTLQMCRDFEPEPGEAFVRSLEELKTYLEEMK